MACVGVGVWLSQKNLKLKIVFITNNFFMLLQLYRPQMSVGTLRALLWYEYFCFYREFSDFLEKRNWLWARGKAHEYWTIDFWLKSTWLNFVFCFILKTSINSLGSETVQLWFDFSIPLKCFISFDSCAKSVISQGLVSELIRTWISN